MARTARMVVPNTPHHVVQSSDQQQHVFFDEGDYRCYLTLLTQQCEKHALTLVAYALMPTHVHLVVVPKAADDLRPIGEVNRCYARYLNTKLGKKEKRWQGRFGSRPLSEDQTYDTVRCIEMTPVRLGICAHPTQYRWSSARARIGKAGDLDLASLPAILDWDQFWFAPTEGSRLDTILRRYTSVATVDDLQHA